MATLRDIRRRISSVKSTQQITKAMKMVAAAKLRRAQERLLNARPYADGQSNLMAHIASNVDRSLHPMLAERAAKSFCTIVVTGDRGLCGSFNANVIRLAKSEIDELSSEKRMIVTIGKKGYEFFSRRGYEIWKNHQNIFGNLNFKAAMEVSRSIRDMYEKGEVDRVVAAYNEFKSVGVQRPVTRQLLPIVPKPPEIEKYEPVDYLYEPSVENILEEVCSKYLAVNIWRVLLESYSSEQAARMVAMESATDNAQEMINDLTLYYNKVRQAAITKEIADIVGGAEALRS
ncbi:MAG: ATP synthase F1 subunit gamma [bacterium]